MPEFIQKALIEKCLLDAYQKRPDYQKNDYIGWIQRARRQETRDKRLNQMLDELQNGNKYMKMDYHPKKEPLRK